MSNVIQVASVDSPTDATHVLIPVEVWGSINSLLMDLPYRQVSATMEAARTGGRMVAALPASEGAHPATSRAVAD